MDAVNRYSKLDYPVAPTLFFEFHGASDASVAEQAETVEAIAAEQRRHALPVGDAAGGSRAALAGAARRVLRGAGARPGARAGRPTSACRSPGSPTASSRRSGTRAHVVPRLAPLVGHAGDGNFHLIYLIDPGQPGGTRRSAPPERPDGGARPGDGRDLHRRARRRLRKDEVSRRRARRGARRHARDQARARSPQPDEPGQDRGPASRTTSPARSANTSGATIVASDSMMYLGVSTPSLPHVIFSFGTAPEYEP